MLGGGGAAIDGTKFIIRILNPDNGTRDLSKADKCEQLRVFKVMITFSDGLRASLPRGNRPQL